MEKFYYRRLEVYQNAKALSHEICKLIKAFPIDERFALCDQLRRAVMSVPINIAEGFGRASAKELELALDEEYITLNQLSIAEDQILSVKRQLTILNRSVLSNGDRLP